MIFPSLTRRLTLWNRSPSVPKDYGQPTDMNFQAKKIAELQRVYKETGTISPIHPPSKEVA